MERLQALGLDFVGQERSSAWWERVSALRARISSAWNWVWDSGFEILRRVWDGSSWRLGFVEQHPVPLSQVHNCVDGIKPCCAGSPSPKVVT